MNSILLTIIIFLEIISYIVIFDVILSWLTIFGLKFRPKFISDVLDPIYKNIKKILPTTFWPIDLTPIIVIFTIIFIKWAIYIMFPSILIDVNNLIK